MGCGDKVRSFSTLGFNPNYDDKKVENEIYIGKSITDEELEKSYRSVSVIIQEELGLLSEKNYKIEEKQREYLPNEDKEFVAEKEEFNISKSLTLYTSPSGQQKFACWLLTDKDSKGITGLHISRRTKKGVYSNEEVTLSPKGIVALKNFLNTIPIIDTKKAESYKIPLFVNEVKDKKVLTSEEFDNLIKQNITGIDDYYKLLLIRKMELGIKQLEKIISGEYKNEVEIQKFLRKNIWMFGNSYSFVIDDTKINSANILDLIPKNLDNFLDIIEVKLPNIELFHFDDNHKNYYPSSSLSKAIAQTQNYIFEFEQKTNDKEYQEKNNCKIIKPRGIIIIGTKEPLNEDENKYLRILNSSYHNIYIMTYHQLLDRAKRVFEVNSKKVD